MRATMYNRMKNGAAWSWHQIFFLNIFNTKGGQKKCVGKHGQMMDNKYRFFLFFFLNLGGQLTMTHIYTALAVPISNASQQQAIITANPSPDKYSLQNTPPVDMDAYALPLWGLIWWCLPRVEPQQPSKRFTKSEEWEYHWTVSLYRRHLRKSHYTYRWVFTHLGAKR